MVATVRRQPQRTCLGCRETFEQGDLVRFVRSPEGMVLADYRSRLPGRGAYTCYRRTCLEKAVQTRQFERAFRKPCETESLEALVSRVLDGVEQHMASLLGMARKSSQAVSGSQLVLAAMGKEKTLDVVILAEDVSAAIGEKVAGKAAHLDITCIRKFSKAEMGRLLGRSERSVVGLYPGQLAEAFLADWLRCKDISGVD